MEIALVVLSIISLSFMIAYMAVVRKLNNVSEAFGKLLVVYNTFLDNKNDQSEFNNSPEDQDTHKENFIKFLSDSRDWAFDYIEDVQSALKKFVSEVEPHISYFDKYGDVLSEKRPDYKPLKQISESLKELKKILPEDVNDRR